MSALEILLGGRAARSTGRVIRSRQSLRYFEDQYFARLLTRARHSIHDWITSSGYQAAHGRAWIAEELFRGIGKSTNRSKILPIYATALGLKYYVVLCSPVADTFLREITEEVTENELLRLDFGENIKPAIDFKAQKKKFDDKVLVFANGSMIEAITPGEPIRGKKTPDGRRPDLIIFDDLLKESEFGSRTIRDKTWAWLNGSALPACAEFGRGTSVILTDTFKHRDAPVQRKIREIQAKEADGTPTKWQWKKVGARDENGRPVFVSEEDLETLADLLDPLTFQREILGKDVSDSEQLFFPTRWPTFSSSGWVVGKGGRRHKVTATHGGETGTWDVEKSVVYIDPASGANDETPTKQQLEKGDWFAVACIGRLTKRRKPGFPIYALPEVRGSKVIGEDFERPIRDVCEMAVRYQVDEVTVESNSGQKFLLPDLRRSLRKAGFRGRVRGRPAKENKVRRIGFTKRELDYGDLLISDRLPMLFFDQYEAMRAWGSTDHDDIPDAVAGGLRRLRPRLIGLAAGSERLRLGAPVKLVEEEGEDD